MKEAMQDKSKGTILVFVLALIVLIGVLSLRLMKETVQELRHVSQSYKRNDLQTHGYVALDVAVGVINDFKDNEGTLYSPEQGWGNPFEYSGVRPSDLAFSENFDQEQGQFPIEWSIIITDESAKIPFFQVSEKDLVALFSVMRAEEDSLVDEDDGQPFYDALLDWQDADDEDRDEGAEDDYYEDLDPPYFTSGKPLESFDEFRWIKGFAHNEEDPEDSGFFYDAKGYETIHQQNFEKSFSFHHDGIVNVNGLLQNPFLAKFLCGDDDDLYEDFMAGPDDDSGFPYFTSLTTNPRHSDMFARMRSIRGIELGTTVSMIRVEIMVRRGKSKFGLTALLGPKNPSPSASKGARQKKPKPSKINQAFGYPWHVLTLRENENLID